MSSRSLTPREEGPPTEISQRRRFASDPAEVGRARAFVRSEFGAWGIDGETTVFELMVSELVTNAIVHGRGDVDVTVSLTGDKVRMEVIDQGRGTGPIGPADVDPLAVGGWGLQVIDGLADDWGARREADRTRVWMERRIHRW